VIAETTLRMIPGYDPWRDAGDCTFDMSAAERATGFFPDMLRHVEGEWAGRPLELEPWQQAIVANLFGWKRPDGTRRYREAFVLVARKNGKSLTAAGLALYLLLADGEPGPQVYCAAADREQAGIVYRDAVGMIVQNRELKAACRIYRSYKSVEAGNAAVFRALSHEAYTKHGLNVHGCIVDELHAHPDGDMIDVLQTATGARRQPITVHITTADFWRPESVCNRKYDYACKVRDGVIADPAFLPVLYEAAESDDWTSPATWRAANPNLGVSISEEYLARECERAKNEPSYQNVFRRLHLNIRTNAETAWLDLAQWDLGGAAFDAGSMAGERCFGGLDLSTTVDLTAFCLFFPESGRALWWYWIPRDTARKAERRDRVPYGAWTSVGDIAATAGPTVDYVQVQNDLLAICETYRPVDVAFDPWNADQMAKQLIGLGVPMIKMRQGYYSLTEPTKALERLVVSGKFLHGGNPVTRWCASNVMLEKDKAGNIMASKRYSTGRIDGIAAAVMAIGRSIVQPPVPLSSYDDGREMLV